MAVNIAPDARLAFFDSNGDPLVGGELNTYAAGSTTPLATYTDSTGNTANSNPIVLDAGGRTPNGVWLSEGSSYKFVLEDSDGVEIWSEDNISGVNDAGVSTSQWVGSGSSPTYVSATQFTVSGDKTDTFTVGRRVRATVTAGTVHGTIISSAYTTLTTVDLIMDGSDELDSGLSTVEVGLLTPSDTSIPWLSDSTLLSTDDGASAGPVYTGYRDSDTPAADDAIRSDKYDGNNDADERTTYAELRGEIEDPSDGTEDGALHYHAMEGGSLTDKGELLATGNNPWQDGYINGAIGSSNSGTPNSQVDFTAGSMRSSDNTENIEISEKTWDASSLWSGSGSSGSRLDGAVLGTVSTSGASTTVTVSGFDATVEFEVGDTVFIANGGGLRITAINSSTEIVINSAVDVTDEDINRRHIAGNVASNGAGNLYWYAIKNPTSGDTGVIVNTRSSDPVDLPSGFTVSRRILAQRTDSSNDLLEINSRGWGRDVYVRYASLIEELSDSSPGTAANLLTTTLPPSVIGQFSFEVNNGSSASILITATSETDTSPTGNNRTLGVNSSGTINDSELLVPVDDSRQIRYRSSAGGADLTGTTLGYIDHRT